MSTPSNKKKLDPASGLEHIDEQHERLHIVLQRLEESSLVSVRSEIISETLSELTRLASEHFRDEEDLLEAHDYPEIEQHKAEHRVYRLTIVSFCCDAIDHKASVPKELLEFLRCWWRDHQEGADQRADDFLRGLMRDNSK